MLHLTICMLVAFFASDVISSNEYAYRCTFQKDLCNFVRSYNELKGMQRVKRNGSYVMLAKGMSAVKSSFIGKDAEACLSVKYEVVNGPLQWHYVTIGDGKRVEKMILMSKSQTSGWKTALVNITSSDYFVVELVVLPSSLSDLVAYDDISIVYGPCRQ